jgi:hypothetical protein
VVRTLEGKSHIILSETQVESVFFFFLFLFNLCFAAIRTHDSSKSIAKDDTKLADPKVFMEAMMSEMRRVMKMEME